MDLIVGQVPDENVLLIEGGLNQPVMDPAKLEIWRFVDDRLVEISRPIASICSATLAAGRLGAQSRRACAGSDRRAAQSMAAAERTGRRVAGRSTARDARSIAFGRTHITGAKRENQDFAPYLTKEGMASQFFLPYDGRLLQEAVWLRDISRWAQGNNFEKLARAEALFDWTVRNIQLDADGKATPQRPWQTLMYGHGTAEQRAWVFALLCRQQGLDVVMLGLARKSGGSGGGRYAGDTDVLAARARGQRPALFVRHASGSGDSWRLRRKALRHLNRCRRMIPFCGSSIWKVRRIRSRPNN